MADVGHAIVVVDVFTSNELQPQGAVTNSRSISSVTRVQAAISLTFPGHRLVELLTIDDTESRCASICTPLGWISVYRNGCCTWLGNRRCRGRYCSRTCCRIRNTVVSRRRYHGTRLTADVANRIATRVIHRHSWHRPWTVTWVWHSRDLNTHGNGACRAHDSSLSDCWASRSRSDGWF